MYIVEPDSDVATRIYNYDFSQGWNATVPASVWDNPPYIG
jgi:hypothetical protein